MTGKIPEGLEVRRAVPKPVELQTVLATNENLPLIVEWIVLNGHHAVVGIDQLTIQTLEGPFTVRAGDQVLYGPRGFTRTDGGEEFSELYDDLGPVES